MTKLTLGQSLQNRINAERENPTLKLMREAKEAGPETESALQAVIAFFEGAKTQFTAAIEQGLTVPTVKLGGGVHTDVYQTLRASSWRQGITVFDTLHHYFPIAYSFLRWCEENELKHTLEWKYNDQDSWYLLSVEANVGARPRWAA
jgi:hypothetical protein